MTSSEIFWKENEAFFRSSFRPDERFLHVEEIKAHRLMGVIQVILGYVILLIVGLLAPIGIRVIMIIVTVYVDVVWILKISGGVFRRQFVVVTSTAVYYCRGLRGFIAFECPISSLVYILFAEKNIRLVSSETAGSLDRVFTSGASSAGMKTFWSNIFRHLAGKPLKNTLCYFSNLCQRTEIDQSMYSMIEIHIKNNSILLQELQKATMSYPQIKFKSFEEVYPLWR